MELDDTMNSPAAIYKDLAIVQGGKPVVRAWNIRTGALVWTFNLIAQPGDPGHDTWEGDSWKNPGDTNVWGYLSIDAARGLVFLPNSMPGSNDYYGGTRHGDNLYGNSVVAVDAATGKMRWYRQLVHHDIWDYDLGAAPALVDVIEGRQVHPGGRADHQDGPAVRARSHDRRAGVGHRGAARPAEHRAGREDVADAALPGEAGAAGAQLDDEVGPRRRSRPSTRPTAKGCGTSTALQDSVPYTPWNDKHDIVLFPGAVGGGNWNGVAVNQPLGLMFTNVMNAGQWGHLEPMTAGRGRRGGPPDGRGAPPAEGRGAPPVEGGSAPPQGRANDEGAPATPTWRKVTPEGRRFWDPETMYSCQAPPWGELVAVSTKTGEIAWHVPLGSFPALEAKGLKTGTPSLGGAITTAGNLIFIAATVDGKFRAFDARNGRELWSDTLDAPGHAIPSTYMGRDGKQYVAIAAGGGGFLQSPTADTLIAFTLQ